VTGISDLFKSKEMRDSISVYALDEDFKWINMYIYNGSSLDYELALSS
jgi:hypothetical protein